MKAWLRALQCWCGHYRDAHSHYRYGTECALCECQRWAPPRWWRLRSLRPGREALTTADDRYWAVWAVAPQA